MAPISARIAMWLVLLTVTGALLLGGCAQPTGPDWTYVPPTPTPSGAPAPSGSAAPSASAGPTASANPSASADPSPLVVPSASAVPPSPSAAPAPGLPQGSDPVTLDPEDFVAVIDNPYLPLPVGAKWTFTETDAEGVEQTIVVEVTDQTRQILGITATVVHDVVSEGDAVIEDTFDWYAQDSAGNVWYLGEDTKEFENGEVVSTAGSWEAGVDGAQPGVIMPADPQAGQRYRQEYLEGQAEDEAMVLNVGELVGLGDVAYTEVVVTRDTTPLEPDLVEIKFYAPGVGLVLALGIAPEQTRAVLVEVALP